MLGRHQPINPARQVIPLTAVTSSGTTGAKGAYVSLGTANFSTRSIDVLLAGSTSARKWRIDLAFSIDGVDTIIAEDLYLEYLATGNVGVVTYRLPVRIPVGADLKCRSSSQFSGGGTLRIAVTLNGRAPGGAYGGFAMRSLVDWGASGLNNEPANLITQSGVASTPSAYATICASAPCDTIMQLIQLTQGADTTRTSDPLGLLELAVGSVGNEVVFASFSFDNSAARMVTTPRFVDFYIPAGSRISARATMSTVAADSLGVVINGLQA